MNFHINEPIDIFKEKNICRICLNKKDTVHQLFRKQNGVSPYEKLKKIDVKTDVNDIDSPSICNDCLIELDITIKFLEKCEKSNQIFAAQLSRGIDHTEQTVNDKSEENRDHEQNAYLENSEDIDLEKSYINMKENAAKICDNFVSKFEEVCCGECGSKRRCQHWSPPKTHTCPYCQKVFTRKFNFKLHLARHAGSCEWPCRRCGARVQSRWQAAAHCAPRARRACPVPGCGKTYTTSTNLATHLRAHTGERPFECSDCGKKFSSKNTLSDHMRIHTGALPYICPVCGKRFRTNKLSAHIATHRGTPRRAPAPPRGVPGGPASAPASVGGHACALCPASYHHRQSLNKHVKKQHSQVK